MIPRSCRLVMAYAVAAPLRSATSEPELRERISPAHGSYPSKTWWAMPVPRVSVGNSVRNPIRPRAGTRDSIRTPAGAGAGHLPHPGLAGGEQLGDGAEVLLRSVDGEPLDGLVHLAVDVLRDHLRLADGQLEPLASHLLDENGQRQLTAALDLP